MTLGEFIKDYRERHDNMSIRSFASLAGMSTQQISNIEKGIGNDGKPMTSTMKTYKKIAKAVGMEETEFLRFLNDSVTVNPVDDEKPATTTDDGQEEKYEEIKRMLDQLTDENAAAAKAYLSFLLQSQKSQDAP